jgi:hypothetical protein
MPATSADAKASGESFSGTGTLYRDVNNTKHFAVEID